MKATDVQLVLDVQGILADHGIDAADITPDLISALIVWHNGSQVAPDSPAPSPAPAPAKAKGAKPSEPAAPAPAADDDDKPF